MTTITASRAELARTLAIGASIVERSVVDVASNVLLSVQRGRANLLFSDLVIWLGRSIDATADAITATTIPAQAFAGAAARFEGDQMTVNVDQQANRAALACGRARIRLSTLPAEDFPRPTWLAEEGGDAAIVEAAQFAEAIERVSYAAQVGPGVNVQGIHINAESGAQVDLVTFDGKAMRGVIKLRKMEKHARDEAEALLETYKAALGLA